MQLAQTTSLYHQSRAQSTTTQGYDPVNYHLPPAPKLEPGQVLEMAGGSLKANNSGGPMVNVINAISGGFNELVHETKR
jgi:hypothetical protein